MNYTKDNIIGVKFEISGSIYLIHSLLKDDTMVDLRFSSSNFERGSTYFIITILEGLKGAYKILNKASYELY